MGDWVVRLGLAQRLRRDFIWHLPDLAMIALSVPRPLRLLRLVLLRVMNRSATDSLRGKVAIYVSGSAVLLVFCASLAVLDAERDAPGASLTTFGDAPWWAVATVCTVGNGRPLFRHHRRPRRGLRTHAGRHRHHRLLRHLAHRQGARR